MVSEQRLYKVGYDRYIQHGGDSPLPADVKAFRLRSRGEDPPHIPLPRGPVVFHLGIEVSYTRRVSWDGRSPLPDLVLKYIREHGSLPRCGIDEIFVDDSRVTSFDPCAESSDSKDSRRQGPGPSKSK